MVRSERVQVVFICTCRRGRHATHELVSFSACQAAMPTLTTWFHFSTRPLVDGVYGELRACSMPKRSHSAVTSPLNSGPWSLCSTRQPPVSARIQHSSSATDDACLVRRGRMKW